MATAPSVVPIASLCCPQASVSGCQIIGFNAVAGPAFAFGGLAFLGTPTTDWLTVYLTKKFTTSGAGGSYSCEIDIDPYSGFVTISESANNNGSPEGLDIIQAAINAATNGQPTGGLTVTQTSVSGTYGAGGGGLPPYITVSLSVSNPYATAQGDVDAMLASYSWGDVFTALQLPGNLGSCVVCAAYTPCGYSYSDPNGPGAFFGALFPSRRAGPPNVVGFLQALENPTFASPGMGATTLGLSGLDLNILPHAWPFIFNGAAAGKVLVMQPGRYCLSTSSQIFLGSQAFQPGQITTSPATPSQIGAQQEIARPAFVVAGDSFSYVGIAVEYNGNC